jgi:hypothetical protein
MPYLYTEVSSIYVVAQEEIASLRRVATNLKELHEIVVLPVNVTAHGNWGIHLQKIGLRLQDLCAFPYDP